MRIIEAISTVEQSAGSMFTKQDVIALLEKLNPEQPIISKEGVEGFLNRVETELSRMEDMGQLVQKETAEFSVGQQNILELENVDVNLEDIKAMIEEQFTEYFGYPEN